MKIHFTDGSVEEVKTVTFGTIGGRMMIGRWKADVNNLVWQCVEEVEKIVD